MTATAPLELVFESGPIPTDVGRAGTPNPFLTAVGGLVGKDESLSFTIPGEPVMGAVDKGGNKVLNTVIRQLRDAGPALAKTDETIQVSVRTKYVKGATKGTTVVTFWTVPKIARKPSDAAPAA